MVFDLRDTLSGVIGSVCCVYVGLPFDVVKLRLQTQRQQQQQQQTAAASSANGSNGARRGAPRHSKSSLLRLSRTAASGGGGAGGFYRGPFDCLIRMASTEGIRSLWKGAIPALSSGISENAALFTANDALKRLFISINRAKYVPDDDDGEFPVEVPLPPPRVNNDPNATATNMTANNAAHEGPAAAGPAAGPADHHGTAPSSSELFHRIHQTTTHPPTFPFPMDEDEEDDEDLDAIIAEYESETALSIGEYYLCGGIAGIFSSTVMCPSEVIKVRLQFQRNSVVSAALSSSTTPFTGAVNQQQQPSNIVCWLNTPAHNSSENRTKRMSRYLLNMWCSIEDRSIAQSRLYATKVGVLCTRATRPC